MGFQQHVFKISVWLCVVVAKPKICAQPSYTFAAPLHGSFPSVKYFKIHRRRCLVIRIALITRFPE